MKLLVTGAAGMLGRATVDAARTLGHDVVGLTHGDLDITDAVAIEDALRSHHPNAVVNCSAWTDVDGAEEHENEARLVNGVGAAPARARCRGGRRPGCPRVDGLRLRGHRPRLRGWSPTQSLR